MSVCVRVCTCVYPSLRYLVVFVKVLVLEGHHELGPPLPHAILHLDDEIVSGETLVLQTIGRGSWVMGHGLR